MVASSDPGCLQGAFNILVGLLDQVGLRTNIGNTVGMVFRPCQAVVTQLEVPYERQIMGEGISYQERQRVRVKCLCLYFWSLCPDNLLIIRWWCSKPRAEDTQTLDSGLIFSTMYVCTIDGFGPPSLPPPRDSPARAPCLQPLCPRVHPSLSSYCLLSVRFSSYWSPPQ